MNRSSRFGPDDTEDPDEQTTHIKTDSKRRNKKMDT